MSSMIKVGFVGWRGMVGSVLMSRLSEENDWQGIEATFFSSSLMNKSSPEFCKHQEPLVIDSYDLNRLIALDIIVTTQGGEYTKKVYHKLRQENWRGYWLDASSVLRLSDESLLVLDPVNKDQIDRALRKGKIKTFVGSNCSVSLFLMAFSTLFQENLVEWVITSTYQAASGAGSRQMRELIEQMAFVSDQTRPQLSLPNSTALALDKEVLRSFSLESFPHKEIGTPLAGNLIPWIDKIVQYGQTREEWKAETEGNKILALPKSVPMDGICVRVGVMRSHSQAVTLKLTQNVSIEDISTMLTKSHPWMRIVPGDHDATKKSLTPVAISGTLNIAVGRLRKLSIGEHYLSAFTVGDQLLWGAAEPLRRMLNILKNLILSKRI